MSSKHFSSFSTISDVPTSAFSDDDTIIVNPTPKASVTRAGVQYELVPIKSSPVVPHQARPEVVSGSEKKETKQSEQCDAKSKGVGTPSILRNIQLRGRMAKLETRLHTGGSLTTGANGKYLLIWPGGGAYGTPAGVTASSEWSAFDSVFQEAFVRYVKITYIPNNRLLVGYVNSTSTDLQSCAVSVCGYQHTQSPMTDGSGNFAVALNATEALLADTSARFDFTWRNVEKFEWGGKADTVAGSTGWMNVSDFSNYGGKWQAACLFSAATVPGPTNWPVSTVLGSVVYEFDVAFRYRD